LLALFEFSARFLDIDRILQPNPKGALFAEKVGDPFS
jgi:hypothetical protein